MVDTVSKERRREIMQSVRSQSSLENLVSRELWKRGIRFRKNVKSLFGTPDIAIKKYKIVIFIDSCFWHACELHGRIPKSNQEFWRKKLERNKQRDKEVQEYYLKRKWHIKRVWEHEIKKNFDQTVNDIIDFIDKAKNNLKLNNKSEK
ncbi:very short patch repair endonuclease [Thermaerobacillus caldiproteolyticus]|uniref:very short patch repair endonuclease n=1 Tax=Thermaerobacillus caldiproteolyticus TaxID=247480 RepID=UPI00188BAE7C|nr:very short patch repair endonuclease [Anoxybacillus caldiproteolyticus]QPA30053.1 very short patch repair endonuclease [Anoxybacillus caldiproteolyticus]